MEPDIHHLIEAAKSGSRESLHQLYLVFASRMYNAALRIIRDKQAAEDVMQEAFIKAFQKIATFRGEVPFEGWLRKIVLHESFQHIRNQKRRQTVLLDYASGDHSDGSENAEPEKTQTAHINQAMQQLPNRYREVLQLFYLEGFDHEEIADILQLTPGNSRTLLFRARESLKKLLH